MNSDQWQKAKEIFDAALKCEPHERAPFLDASCGGDAVLHREVESLLAASDDTRSFLEQPAVGEVAEIIAGQTSPAGKILSHYKILSPIGAGGMGEVYLAQDIKLDRNVAIKILKEKFAKHESNLRRFIREAKAASALNHPNILVIHEISETEGTHYIVSEYIEGITLRERFEKSPMQLPEILGITIQIASALTAAHGAHIIHRDIKPENIVIRPDGYVKILDFGLAKLTLKKSEINDVDDKTQTNTAPGIIMGTAAYMSPEQARGKETDARSDIWSLGVVLYEMQSGKPPFKGETTSDTIASILMREPVLLDESIPAELSRILQKALQKNREERYQTVEDFLSDIKTFKHKLQFAPLSAVGNGKGFKETMRPENVAPEDTTSIYLETPTSENRSSFNSIPIIKVRWWSNKALIVVCVLLVAFAGAAFVWKIISQNRNQAPLNSLALLRPKTLIKWDSEAGEGDAGARFSPNGTMIAYSQMKNGQRNIWTKQIPDGKHNQITEGEGSSSNPIWSPDGQRIAFVSNRDYQMAIWAMPFSGGELTLVKTLESAAINLLHWSKNGATIYYQQGFNFFALNVASKQITQLTNFNLTDQAQFFSISPNEDRIAYSSGTNERLHIFVMPIDGGQPVQVTSDEEASDENPFWLPDGERIIYSSKRGGIFQTWIAYLDERKPEPINLGFSDTLISDVASDGGKILFYQSREESDLWRVKIDRKSETQITSDYSLELWSDVSPDGKSIVFQSATESKHLLEGSILIRSITAEQQKIAPNGFSPTFSPDGRKVAFLRETNNLSNLWITDKNGADERQLTTDGIWFDRYSLVPYNRLQVKDYSWSPDGNNLIYCAEKDGLWNVWHVAADGANAPQPITTNTDADVKFSCPLFAPDGKRIAYTSSTVKLSSGATTTNLCLLSGENTEIVFSSESVFKLIGWGQSGNNLLIAMSEKKPTAKPTKVGLVFISVGNNRTDLASIEAAYFNNIQLSPDGRRIAYAAHENGKDNIRVISSAGGENSKITTNVDPTTYISSIAWSPDSKAVYYSKQKKEKMILMIENFK